jgi:hypothetical protein
VKRPYPNLTIRHVHRIHDPELGRPELEELMNNDVLNKSWKDTCARRLEPEGKVPMGMRARE